MSNSKMTELSINLKITILEEDIDQIMCSALEGGITYWCDEVKIVGEYLGEYAHEQIARGGKLILHDMWDDKIFELTLEDVMYGIKKYFEKSYDFGCILESYGRIDPCKIDGVVADSIIQYAIFGEIIYA